MPTRAAASSTRSHAPRKAPPRAAAPARKRASNADHAGHGGHRSGPTGHGKSSDAKTARGDSDTAPAARRAIWKGAISFGLLHVPVALYPASRDQGVDFDWLDKRSMDPVGYKRINKRTGKDIDKAQIVKGVRQDNGDYVLVSDDEIRKAYPTTTQTIEIETFVPATQVSFVYLEKPYYLEPVGKASKVYALLREAMADSGLIAIARLVIHSKEHLAALLPAGPALMIGMLRWANEIRPCEDLNLPAEGKSAHGFKAAELQMARQLIDEMSTDWHPEDYHDEFTAAIRRLIARKVEQGKTETVTPLEAEPDTGAREEGGKVVDLTELLRRSLGGKKKPKAA
ncbi:non-homologous end joining protein Ku [Roseateles chitosanitabidus]|uniref:non-homologous end joining protein Ku n=1 Tax=Roseateles chitosanitabidus TaxID=65048 RepID=UPI000ADC6342|nr:Ku protein [Roseateles chitosanitabidus]MBO9687382.1 Ku protein [Roseateles chitosanitabidus]